MTSLVNQLYLVLLHIVDMLKYYVSDMKIEPDPLLPEVDPEENQEIYSCNTCGVSFSSVIDHIQNYHNDQDVVVEVPVV